MTGDRRHQGRYRATGPARVRWHGFRGEDCATRARVQDVSARGMGLLLREPLLFGHRVWVRLGEAEYPGRVRHCRGGSGGFLAGVEIVIEDAAERWQWLFCRRLEAGRVPEQSGQRNA